MPQNFSTCCGWCFAHSRAPTLLRSGAVPECALPRARNLKTKPMIDFIFIAVIALFFVASGFYARWCEKL
jgi:hypothetical protein